MAFQAPFVFPTEADDDVRPTPPSSPAQDQTSARPTATPPSDHDNASSADRLWRALREQIAHEAIADVRVYESFGPIEEPNAFDHFLRDYCSSNVVPFTRLGPPPGHLEPPPEKEPLWLDDIDDQTLATHVAQREQSNPQFVTALKNARTAFAEAASPSMELPTKAPELWAKNPEGLTATAFVAKHYAPWIEAGVLTLKAIGNCDADLPKAYSNRAHRHPEEALPLAKAVSDRFIADPQAALDSYRTRGRESKARYRKRDKMAHEPG